MEHDFLKAVNEVATFGQIEQLDEGVPLEDAHAEILGSVDTSNENHGYATRAWTDGAKKKTSTCVYTHPDKPTLAMHTDNKSGNMISWSSGCGAHGKSLKSLKAHLKTVR